jgi:hypothetical protein
MVSTMERVQDAGTAIGFVSGGQGAVGMATLSDIIEQPQGVRA